MTTHHPFSSSAFSPGASWAASSRNGSVLERLGRGLVIATAAGGALLALYRNDVLLAAARHGGVETRYLQVESAWMGGPAAGTPRSLEPLVARSRAWFERLATPGGDTARAKSALGPSSVEGATPAAVRTAAAADGDTARPAPRAETTPAGLRVVSLDALPVLKAESAAPRPVEAPRAATAAAPTAKRTAVADAVAAPRSAKAELPRAAARAESPVRTAATPKRELPVKPREAPVERKPAPAPVNDNPLKAAIRSAILQEAGK